MIGFITNYEKSKRFIEHDKLQRLINIDKKNVNFVSVLVNPEEEILEKIKKRLGEKVSDVVISERLIESASCLILPQKEHKIFSNSDIIFFFLTLHQSCHNLLLLLQSSNNLYHYLPILYQTFVLNDLQ